MRVLVIGAGVYVTGRGTDGLGTVLPAIAEASRTLPIQSVTVAATRTENASAVRSTTERVNALLGTQLETGYGLVDDVFDKHSEKRSFDCAIVAVPDHLHAEVGSRALEAGLHVLMVKPFAPTLAEARHLEALRARAKLYGMVEFHKRWDEANLIVRRLIAEKRLGRLAYVDVEYSQRDSVPLSHFRAWAERTNIFQYLGVHYVDLIYFLTGFRPVRAMAVGTRGILDARGVHTWDSVHAIVLWQAPDDQATKLLSQFSTNWIDSTRSTAMSDQKYRVIGEHGRVDCDQKNRGVELTTSQSGVEAVNPYFSQFLTSQEPHQRFAGYGFESFRGFLADVHAIDSGKAAPADFDLVRPTFGQALVSTAVVEAVNRSLATAGEWSTVDAAS